MVRFSLLLMICFSASLLMMSCSGSSGWIPSSGGITDKPQLVGEPDKVSALLADAATRASVAMETLAAVETAKAPGIAAPPIGNAPPELLRPVNLSWIGPAGPVAKSMADRAGYVYKTIGTPPPTPIIVSIDVQRSTVIDVLRSVGLQLGKRADVRIDSTQQIVELHYINNEGAQPQRGK